MDNPIDESMEIQLNQQEQQLHHINKIFLNYRKNISYDEQQQLSQHNIDSAYGSGYNLITPNTTPNVSSTNLNDALTPQRNNNNNNLNVIHENFLNNDSINLTPVTQNINRIYSFHITTPKSQDFLTTLNNNNNNQQNDTKKIFNIKRSSDNLYDFDNYQSTPKKFKILYNDSVYDKSRDSTPLKKKENIDKNLKFRKKLHSAPNLDNYFDENLFSPKKLNKTSNNNRIPFINLLSHNNIDNIDNKKSTSTPISSTIIHENTDTVKKLLNCSNEQFNNLINAKEEKINKKNHLNNIVDESLEFNDYYLDSNLFDLKNNNNCSTKINTYKPIKIETNAAKTPFRRFLSFTNYNDTEFKSPQCKLNNNDNTNTQLNSIESNRKNSNTSSSDDEFYLENSFRQYKKQYRILNTVCNDRLRAKQRANAARLVHLENSYNDELVESSSTKLINNNKHINQSLILSKSKKHDDDDNDEGISSIIFDKEKSIIKDDYIPITPPKRKLSLENEVFTSTDSIQNNNNNESDKRLLSSISKKFKIYSKNNIQNNNNINFEKFDIIYPTIPTTPRKNSIQLSPKKKQNQEYRKNYEKLNNQYKKFYDGAIHLNIITKLELYPVVLDRIFDYLSNCDLLNLSMVTKTHRKIIKENLKANRRLKQYLNDFQISKENYCIKEEYNKECKKSQSEIISSVGNNCKKMPFTLCNTKYDRKRSIDIIHSPPVSPSKKKFYEHQKIVNTLSVNQSVSNCPRCAKASRIVNTLLEEAIHNNNNNFTNQFQNNKNLLESFHMPSTIEYFIPKKCDDETITTQSQPIKATIIRPKPFLKSASVDTGLLQIKKTYEKKIPFQPFAECLSNKCNFKYCLDCRCEYHPGIKCKLTASISPSKEDIQNGILQLINSPYSKKAINNAATRSSKMLRRKSLKRLCF